jgi:rRNA maturation RNase YbeY
MKTRFTIADKRFKVDLKAMRLLTGKVLKGESADRKYMDVVYCSDSPMIKLNYEFKNKNHVTDVLAFGLNNENEPDYLGEIYINLQQAKRQAKEHKEPYIKEVERLTVHGVLHLLGYTDENIANRKKMWGRQEGYL